MNQYTKVISFTGTMYIKEYDKIKHHKNKIREITESTVIKEFKKGNTEIIVYNEENDFRIVIDSFTDEDTIKKYLGKKFL